MLTKDNAAVALDAPARIKTWWDGVAAKVRAAWAAKDETALNALLGTAPTPDVMGVRDTDKDVHIHTGGRDEEAHAAIGVLTTRLAAFDALLPLLPKLTKLVADGESESEEEKEEARKKKEAEDRMAADLAAEAPTGMADKARLAKDSEYLADAHQEAAAGSEILVPGISVPAYDRAAAPKVTLDAVCHLRRTALDLAYTSTEGRALLDQLLGGKKLQLDGMSCADVRTLFRTAVTTKKATTNSLLVARPAQRQTAKDDGKNQPIRSIADLNARNAARYERKS